MFPSSWCSGGVDDMKRLRSLAAQHCVSKFHLKAVYE